MISTSTSDYDIIAGSETWFNPKILSNEFICKKYTQFRKDRISSNITASKGGGVFIAVRDNIQCNGMRIPEMIDLEAVCVKIKTKCGFVYIYCLYICLGSSLEIYKFNWLS